MRTTLTPEEKKAADEANTKRQREVAKKIEEEQKEKEIGGAASHIDTKLTDAGHTGRHPIQPLKDRAAVISKSEKDLLVGGAKDVHTIDQKSGGKTTDQIVTEPNVGAKEKGGPLDEAQVTGAAARGESTGRHNPAPAKAAGKKR